MHLRNVVVWLVAALTSASLLYGAETRVVVHVLAKDAKFIGTSMGGALVTIRDTDTGELLAKGFTSGTTGNTRTLMLEPRQRGVSLSDDQAAKFVAVLDIDEPRLVTISAQGPYAQRQAMATTSTQIWLIPGKDITGDGVVLEISGFAVDVLQPQAHQRIRLQDGTASIPIRLNLVMM